MANPEIGIVITAANETEEGLTAAGESVKAFQAQTEETGAEFKSTSDAMSRDAIVVGESCDIATHKIVEQGKEIRNATKDYKLANIEQMQYNQILQMTGSTAVSWGSKMQGSHNIVNEATKNLTDSVNKATDGLATYVGAGVQVLGQGIEIYAQVSRLAFMWGMHAAAVGADAVAVDVNTVATGAAVPVQWSLNAALAANPIGAVALAFAAAATAITLAYYGIEKMTANTKESDKQYKSLITTIDNLGVKLKNLYAGENEDVRSLMAQRATAQGQVETLGEKARAAEKLGYADRQKNYEDQQREAIKNVEEIDAMIEEARKKGPNMQELGATWAKEATAATKVAYKKFYDEAMAAGEGGIGGVIPEDSPAGKKLIEKSKKWGESFADAVCQGFRDGFYTPENQAIIDEGLRKFGIQAEAHSPPVVGPLVDIEKWGRNLALSYGEGVSAGFGDIERNISRGLEMSIAPQFDGKGGNSTITNNDERRQSNVTVQLYISGVDESQMARRVMKELSSYLG